MPECKIGEQSAVSDLLFFGTGKPGGSVSTEEWAEFLRLNVTPQFPEGFTVSHASGQWRGADGLLVKEASYLIHLIHADDFVREKAVQEIITTYKSRYRQQAVLRVKTLACVSL